MQAHNVSFIIILNEYFISLLIKSINFLNIFNYFKTNFR